MASILKKSILPTVVIIFSVLLSLLGLVFVTNLPLAEATLGYLFDRGNPAYSGIELNVNRGEVYRIAIGYDSPIPKQFFILVNDSPKRLQDITTQDFLDMGFEPSDTTPGVFIHGDPSYKFDLVAMSAKGLKGMSINRGVIQFSASKNGPFLKLPVPYEKFKEQFGEPESHVRRMKNWRDPR